MGASKNKPDVFSRMCVGTYRLVRGRLRLPGTGFLLRRAAAVWPGLQHYPLPVPGVGTAILDFRDGSAYGMVNSLHGQLENDAPLLLLLQRLLKPGDVFWDVGANVGYFAQSLMRPPFQIGQLHAFEPSPPALHCLMPLFSENGRATVHPIGLGAKNETLEMSVDPRQSVLSSFVLDLPGSVRRQVPIRRADDYRLEQNVPMPQVIKIDVEGFEPRVLEGMAQTIALGQPFIIFEHLWLTDEQITELVPPGYELLFLLDDSTMTRDFARRRLGANGLLVPAGRRDLSASLLQNLRPAADGS